ncbi:MAG: hypothetical protein GY920_05970 [Aliivibrio sp.]|nr:hypothetical protein [Aliivibrio sp.]
MSFDPDEFLDTAFRNSYDVIINNKSAQDMIESDVGYFVHDPSAPDSANEALLEEMREYFSDTEEYEKCIEINNYISKTFL